MNLGVLNTIFMRWQNIVDFLVLATVIYWLLLWGKQTHVLRIVVGIGGLITLGGLARQLGLPITAWLLHFAAITSVLLLVLVYYSEIRYALTHLDPFRRLMHPRPLSQTSDVVAISEAAFSLAAAHRGALIVLRENDSIEHLLVGGVPLGGQISQEILEAIFRKLSPVHDGAVVIDDGHISRVGVFLPLTNRADLPNHYGTRHRAAIGLTERSDAVVIAVSEERGEVTLAAGSALDHIKQPSELIERIQRFNRPAPALSGRKFHHRLFGKWKLKLSAIGTAALVWGLLFLPGNTVRTFTVPIEFENVSPGLEVAESSPSVVVAQLRAATWIYGGLDAGSLVGRVDLKGMSEGPHTAAVWVSNLDLPPGISLEQISPPTISVRLIRQNTSSR
jgi:diadenylate cyclase